MNRTVATELARLLRAEVPPLEDEQFVLTLAEVARNSTTVSIPHRVRLGVKVGAIAASVAVTIFGAAYASDLLAPAPPTNSNPTSPDTDEPTERERQIRGPRKSDDPVDVSPSPATVTKSSDPDGVPTEAGTADATAPAGTEQEQPPEGPATEQPPPQSDPGSGDDDSEGEPDSNEPDDDSGPDGDGSGDDNEPDPGDDPEPDSESGDDSGPEPQDEPDDSSDDD